jgi:hypothetical protein
MTTETADAPTTLDARMALPTYVNPNDLVISPTRFKDKDGREWRLAKNVLQEWVKIRKYDNASKEECEANGGHEVWPKRWPPIPRFTTVGPVKMEVPGYEAMPCERCGAVIVVTLDMLEPGSDVKVVLPKKVA